MTVVLHIAFAGLLLLAVAASQAEEVHDTESHAKEVLMKTVHAMAKLNYQGTVAFLRNGKLETMKYFHVFDKGVEQERLLSLNSPLREIVRDEDKVSCLFKVTKQMVVDYRPSPRSFLLDLPKNLTEIGSFYGFEVVGEEDVAMLPAYVIRISPKDDYRYARKIWVEQKQFLPLKVEVYDTNGATLEQVVFTDIEVKDKLPMVDIAKEQAKPAPVSTINPIQAAQVTTSSELSLNSLSVMGFSEVFLARRALHNSGQMADHLLLSDGFASVSVYMETKTAATASDQSSTDSMQTVGAVNFYSRNLDENLLTVLGDVPAKTVKAIAQAVKIKHAN